MKSITREKLDELAAAEWFARVGTNDLAGVKMVQSWLDAIAHCVGTQWENTRLEAGNILSTKIVAISKARYNTEWNETVRCLRPMLIEFVREKSGKAITQHKLPEKFFWSVYADMLGIAMECEFSDIVKPGLWVDLAGNCYLRGHFPCGWEGEFPQGGLIVY